MSDPSIERQNADALAVLSKDVGTWDAAIEIRMAPGAPPQMSRGTSTSRLVGGRWLITDFRNESGFEGHGVHGWDAARRAYTGVWVDSQRGFLAVGEGTWDPGRGTMTFVTEATLGDRRVRWREITETREDGARIYRNLMPGPDGREFEMMTVTYTRRA